MMLSVGWISSGAVVGLCAMKVRFYHLAKRGCCG
ncbi:hypothetical protein PANA5342_pPANA10243 (plasmid) [Pantoea ananatis LMG 5342]|nr:hypothetical protein PANA5342_pPANA10243 [Pantoea ananatis LMG 5342]